jgi:hypothetical protein
MLENVRLAWKDNAQLRKENKELKKLIAKATTEIELAHKMMREYTEMITSLIGTVEKKFGDSE